jgi:hypothetical protein
LVPSRSIDVSRISPAPRSSASRAHATACARRRSSRSARTRRSRRAALGIDRDDHGLTAVPARKLGDQIRLTERRGVETDLVGAGLDHRVGVGFGADAAADGQRQKDLVRDRPDRARQCLPRFERRSDVEHHHLVDAFDVVAARQLARIAGMTQLLKLHALDDLAVAHVETRDDSPRQHQRAI